MLCAPAAPKKGGFLQLLAAALSIARQRGLLETPGLLVAIDSTGLETRHISHYYGKRCGRRMKHFPKLSVVCDTESHLFLSAVIDKGPIWDLKEFRRALLEAHQLQPFGHVVADAGYDAEYVHGFIRLRLGAGTTIPARRGRRPKDLPAGEFRRQMATDFDKALYAQRWQIESAFSQCKRRLGSALSARNQWAQRREIELKILTHNLMIIRRHRSFQQSKTKPFCRICLQNTGLRPDSKSTTQMRGRFAFGGRRFLISCKVC